MVVKTTVKTGEYFDSVTLMTVAKRLNSEAGVLDSAVVMGTAENKAILKASDLLVPALADAKDADLLIAVKAESEARAEEALRKAERYLKDSRKASSPTGGTPRPRSLDAAVAALPGANMALVSVAGRFAGALAADCLERGLHVMLFSDNVPLETEVSLKRRAREKGLLVMGPDCGTAIVNGVPLAFANSVRRGGVGIVAAAGTGLQEVSCLLSNEGAGVSQALGTGGRDVKKEVGGITFIQALQALAEDPETKVLLLVSKPPHPEVLKSILDEVRKIEKPVVAVFLGGKPLQEAGLRSCLTLEEAALEAAALAKGEDFEDAAARLSQRESELLKKASSGAGPKGAGRRFVRGLFSGGTFCSEAQVLLTPLLGPVRSNAPLEPSLKLKDSLRAEGHCVVDLGEDEFTVGRPHPMIDFSLRNKRILEEAADPQTAVILLDLVLGHGSNPRPLEDILPVLGRVLGTADSRPAVVCSVTGTDEDPQCRRTVVEALEKAGVLVAPTNASACRLAAALALKKEEAHV